MCTCAKEAANLEIMFFYSKIVIGHLTHNHKLRAIDVYQS